ncbi:MAG TPA: LPS export ABC transporter periplasmic protein LptC [Cellvibrio sp.]|nr:LPS export ABC transporter periplasmic protein LptC [Cellvibrio sp.]
MPETNISAKDNLKRLNPLLLPLPWLLVAAFLIIFGLLKYSGNVGELIETEQAVKEFPQVFMTNVDMREFTTDGSLHLQLKTPLIRHFQKGKISGPEDYTLFDLPQIVFLGDEKKPAWYMTAQLGRNYNNGDHLTLSTDVLAQQTSKSQGTISISTSELQVNTREQFAETDKTVTMRSAKTHLQTKGMRASIKEDHIELLSNVTGTYEP